MDESAVGRRTRTFWKAILGTVIFSLIAFFAFTFPDHPNAFSVSAFARLPLEWPVLALLVLLTGGKIRKFAIFSSGLLIFLVLFLRLADIGVQSAFQRQFNPYLDIKMIRDGWNLISGTIGTVPALIAVIGASIALLLVLALFLKAAAWMARIRGKSRPALIGLFCLIILTAVLVQKQGGAGIDFRVSAYLTERLAVVVRSVNDMRAFEKDIASGVGPRNGEGLFQAVAGKDVVLVFVESYGRSAVEDPRYSNITLPRLDAIEEEITAAGLKSASGWVKSPTVGGLSWLAHGTLLSGLWIDSQARYDRLIISGQPSLNRLFSEAGWRSVAVMPAITMAWPEADYFGYRQIFSASGLEYRGQPFNWVTMPDQYTLSAFERLALKPAHAAGQNVMAEIALISSHAPWTPVAKLIDWDLVGDGTVFNAQATSGESPSVVWADRENVRSHYIQTIDYSLATLGSFMARHGNNTVFIILGDHQPASIVTGPDASRDVPIHIVTDDKSLLASFAAAGFTEGMTPSAKGRERLMSDMRTLLIDIFSAR